MKTKLDKLASFRINSERWKKFMKIAEAQGKTATDLLNEYIDRVIGVGADAAPGLPSDAAPKLSIRDIDKRIDKKISNTLSMQDIDATTKKLIAESLEDGEIGEAIAKIQQKFSDENNELQRQIYALEASLEELKRDLLSKMDDISENCSKQSPDTSPQSPVTSKQSPVTNHQSPVTSPQSTVPNHQLQITEEQKLEVIELLGIGEIVGGAIYYKQLLIDQGIDDRIKTNTKPLESLGITFNGNQKQPVAKLNLILSYLGYATKNIGQKTIDGTRGIECYQVLLP